MSQFKIANRQAILDIHKRRLTSVNGAEAELTGIENLLTPGLMKKSRALKRGCWNAVLGEQDRQDACGYCDPGVLALAAKDYSRRATQRAQKIAIMNHERRHSSR